METNSPVNTTQSTASVQPQENLLSPSSPKWKILFFILLGLFVLVLLGGGYYWYHMQKTHPAHMYRSITQKTNPSPTPNPTAFWGIYTNELFAIKYPPTWEIQGDKRYPSSVQVYDANSLAKGYQNGGSTISYPTQFMNISSRPSTQTIKEYADTITSNSLYVMEGSKEQNITVNTLPAIMYKEAGEGSQGYDIVLSNGKELVVLTVPSADITTQPISQMLASLKFLPQYTDAPRSVVQQYYNWYLSCMIDHFSLNNHPENGSSKNSPSQDCPYATGGILTNDLVTKFNQPEPLGGGSDPIDCAQNIVNYVTYGDVTVASDTTKASVIVYPEPYHTNGEKDYINVGLQNIQNQWKIYSITCH